MMRRLYLISLAVIITCWTVYDHLAQRDHVRKARDLYQERQGELKSIEADLKFLGQSKDQLDFLLTKGWFTPHSRLAGGEWIHQWAESLNAVHVKVEPETIKEMRGGYRFKVSRIIIQVEALLDTHIYFFSRNILKNFPGILVLRKISLSRHSNLVSGELIFDWFVMEGKKDED